MAALHPLALTRGKAYLRDCVGYLGIAAATVPLGLLAQQLDFSKERWFMLVASALPPTLATLLAARREASLSGATPGKRRYGLQVHNESGQPPSFGQALLRNVIKIAIPWQLGHTVAIGAAFGGFDDQDPVTIVATVTTYPLLVLLIGSIAFGEGRAFHDRIAGSNASLKKMRRLDRRSQLGSGQSHTSWKF